MKKGWIAIGIFLVVWILLFSLQFTDGVGRFSDLVENEGERYHPNGSEPVYVGIFGG